MLYCLKQQNMYFCMAKVDFKLHTFGWLCQSATNLNNHPTQNIFMLLCNSDQRNSLYPSASLGNNLISGGKGYFTKFSVADFSMR